MLKQETEYNRMVIKCLWLLLDVSAASTLFSIFHLLDL